MHKHFLFGPLGGFVGAVGFVAVSCSHAVSRSPQSTAALLDTPIHRSQEVSPITENRKLDGPAMDRQGSLFAANFSGPGTISTFEPSSVSAPATGRVLWTLPDAGMSAALRFDQRGSLYFTDYLRHRLYRAQTLTAPLELIVEDARMNQPNDFTIASDGTVYLTDPSWNKEKPGRIWRLDRQRQLSVLIDDIKAANGIDLSPDELLLYFSESITGTLFVARSKRSCARVYGKG